MKFLVKVELVGGKVHTYTTEADHSAAATFSAYDKYGVCAVTVVAAAKNNHKGEAMELNKEHLHDLAALCADDDVWIAPGEQLYLQHPSGPFVALYDNTRNFIAYATPARVLALLEENELLSERAPPAATTASDSRAVYVTNKQRCDLRLAGPGANAHERYLLAELARLQAAVIADSRAQAPSREAAPLEDVARLLLARYDELRGEKLPAPEFELLRVALAQQGAEQAAPVSGEVARDAGLVAALEQIAELYESNSNANSIRQASLLYDARCIARTALQEKTA